MIVADASAILELLLGGRRGQSVERFLLDGAGPVHAPALIDAEVSQGLRRLAGSGVITEARGRASIEILQDMPLDRWLLTPLLPRLWQLRSNLTAYDAAYVALAEALQCPLLTFEERLAGAPGHGARVVIPTRD